MKHLVSQTSPACLTRVQNGDFSLQAVAELTAYYIRLREESGKRLGALRTMCRRDIIDLYQEYELDQKYPVTKNLSVLRMALAIEVLEYPREAYQQALTSAGIAVESLENYSSKHIPKAFLLYYS